MNRYCGTKIYLGSQQNRRYLDEASFYLIKDLVTLPPADVLEDDQYTIETDVHSSSVFQSPYKSGQYKVVSDVTGGRLVALHVEERFRGRLWVETVYHPNSLAIADVVEERIDQTSAFHLIPGASFSNVHIFKRTTARVEAWGYPWTVEFREIHTAPEITEPPDEYYYFTEAVRYQISLSTPDPRVSLEVIQQTVTTCVPSLFGRLRQQ